jgi:hypothetical protein
MVDLQSTDTVPMGPRSASDVLIIWLLDEENVMKSIATFIVGMTLALPFAAFAQSADAKYCEALSVEYRKLNTGSESGAAADAMANCKAGNTAAGIPVLEKALTDQKVTLPPRG